MSNFFSFKFYFDTYPAAIHPLTFYIITGLFLLIFVLGLICAFFISKKKVDGITKKIYEKIANWGLWSGIIGLFILFLKYQRAPYLGMRVWSLLWILFTLVWLILIIKFYLKDVPKLKKQREQKKQFNKYLP